MDARGANSCRVMRVMKAGKLMQLLAGYVGVAREDMKSGEDMIETTKSGDPERVSLTDCVVYEINTKT
jgi:hypothetical protein